MTNFNIPEMTSGRCARSITTAIQAIDAQAQVEIDIPGRRVSVDSNANKNALVEAIREADYDAQLA
jgi:copper chaperone